jgi:hypothetical protein
MGSDLLQPPALCHFTSKKFNHFQLIDWSQYRILNELGKGQG